MKKLICTFLILLTAIGFSAAQNRKLTKEEKANMTPEQRIAYDNDRAYKKSRKGKKKDTTKDKVKRAKKNDRAARRTKPPKH